MGIRKFIQRVTSLRRRMKVVGAISLLKIKYPSANSRAHITLSLPIVKNKVSLRHPSIDVRVFRYVFYEQWHKPISEVKLGKNPVIVDLGSNIGLSILTFNHWYPGAQIIGYEMDAENFSLAKKNTSSLKNVTLVNKAIYHERTIIQYGKHGREDAYSIGSYEDGLSISSIEAITIPDVLIENNISKIDYLKVDIEGAEIDILNKGDLSWLKMVQHLNIEFHLDNNNDIEQYIKILSNEGFIVHLKEDHWASITAIKVA